MKKLVISKLFLYRHRFIIGYSLLTLAFLAVVFLTPLISPAGISTAEMESVLVSKSLNFDTLLSNNLIDLPYHALQKLVLAVFGLNFYTIKLPSMLVSLALGVFTVLLLNRWFKNNVALLTSILAILSTPFLTLSGTGTPDIMLVFWPTFLLWLGSKIQGENAPKPAYCFVFAVALLLAIFTPYLIYFAAFVLLFVCAQPHLRATIKNLPKFPLVILGLFIIAAAGYLGLNLYETGQLRDLLLAPSSSDATYLANLKTAFKTVFSWNGQTDGTILTPLISLPILLFALVGLFSTAKGFLASRNSIATCLLVFTAIICGFNPNSIFLISLPIAILTAHGFRYTINKWYDFFPSNPYARIAGLIPIVALLALIIIPDYENYIDGYRYSTTIAPNYTNDLQLIANHDLPSTLYLPSISAETAANSATASAARLKASFYQLLDSDELTIVHDLPTDSDFYTLDKLAQIPENYEISQIITSPKSEKSDRIYVYSVKTAN